MTDRTELDAMRARMDDARLRPDVAPARSAWDGRPNIAFAESEGRRAAEDAKLSKLPGPPPPVLIALTSPAMAAGKSVVARRLVERHNFVPVKFAGPLKDMIRSFLGGVVGPDAAEVERMVEGDLKETPIDALSTDERKVTPRWLMQSLGTEWGRDCIRPDLWVHMTRIKVAGLLARNRSVVIDDMRFFNEFDLVAEFGGVPVRVIRPGIADATGHRSEGELAAVPMDTLANSSTIEDLHALTDGLVKIVRARVAGPQTA